jgi:hypothetical protein
MGATSRAWGGRFRVREHWWEVAAFTWRKASGSWIPPEGDKMIHYLHMATSHEHVVRAAEKEPAWHGAYWFIGFRFVILLSLCFL